MSPFAKGLQALDDPRNEPIKWLLADALRHHAETTNGPHFLLEALARPARAPMLAGWNSYIHQFRELLINADDAPHKAKEDLKSGKDDAEEKLTSFMAEIMAAIHLRTLGYQEFCILKRQQNAVPDFAARLLGKEVSINGGAIIDHEAPLKRRFVAVQK